MSKTGEMVEFQYNANGLRVRKESTSRGVTEYILRGKQIAHLTRTLEGAPVADMHFWYDAQGKAAMVSYNGKEYLYVYNVQGDVVALLDKGNSNSEVVRYGYDAWGKQISCEGSLAGSLGVENPFRYRGYVYDEETGLYSSPARFYNPEWGRFINADVVITRNLFAYCSNNPVMKLDRTGCYEEDAPTNTFNLDAAIRSQKQMKLLTGKSATVTGTSKTVTVYGPYAEAIADRLGSPNETYKDSDCQNEVRLVLPSNSLHNGSGGMWTKNVIPHAAAQAHDLVFSDCTSHDLAKKNCKTYADDHKGHVGFVVWADWHDGNGPVLSVFQSCAPRTHPAIALWENDEEGGPNLTGFSDGMVYFGAIKPEFLQ